MNPILRKVILITSIAGAALAALHSMTRNSHERQEIQRNLQLDLEAIETAKDVVLERLRDPERHFTGVDHVMEDFNHEVKFQQIAVREDI